MEKQRRGPRKKYQFLDPQQCVIQTALQNLEERIRYPKLIVLPHTMAIICPGDLDSFVNHGSSCWGNDEVVIYNVAWKFFSYFDVPISPERQIKKVKYN